MDKDILDGYNSPQGAEDYTGKFERHWIERINNAREQRLVRTLLGDLPQSSLTLDLPCGYGRMQYLREILRISARSVVFTYFDTESIKNKIHRFKRRFKPRNPKCTLPRQDIQTVAGESGFTVTRSTPLSRLFSGHQYTVLQRQ